MTPSEYFYQFFSEDLITLIVEQSNLYSFQKFQKPLGVSFNEIKDFLGIELWMGVVKLPAYTDYWSQYTRFGPVANVMPIKRYQQILRCLHFTYNEDSDETDRYFKVRPVLDIIRSNCLKVSQGQRFSIDEMMVPYKGKKAGSRRQYMQNKPNKWGFKFCTCRYMVYDFLVYSGDCTFRNMNFSPFEISHFGLGPRVVIALCSTIPNKLLSVVYFDNFFTTPELIFYLRDEFGILSLGTLRKQHLRGCPLIYDKKLNKLLRCSFSSQCDNNKKVIITKWKDNKIVSLASSYASKYPIESIQRYSKIEKKKFPFLIQRLFKNIIRKWVGLIWPTCLWHFIGLV